MKLIDANTVELTATFDEPATNTDGTPLADLDYSTVYITTPAGTIKAPVIQESKPTGGGTMSTTIQVNAPANAKTTIHFAVSSTDTAGNEGPKTPDLVYVVDRIAPAAPTNFSIA